jgi:NDP-sugar pyrophosphorylase family protein
MFAYGASSLKKKSYDGSLPMIMPKDLDIVILAGGLGTRLSSIPRGVPKILAPIGNRTFLDHLLGWISRQGATRVVLCLGHLAGAVQEHLAANGTYGLEIAVSVEPQPLGTGGALALAFRLLKSDPVMVMNGDTFVDVSIMELLRVHRESAAKASIVCAWVEQSGRYGKVEVDSNGYVLGFVEKDRLAVPSWINAGIYLFDRLFLDRIEWCRCISLERDLLNALPPGVIHAIKSRGLFLDIGTPEALAQASALLLKHYNIGTKPI